MRTIIKIQTVLIIVFVNIHSSEMATIFDNFAQRRLSPPRRSAEGERVTSLIRPGSPLGAQRAFRHNEAQLVSNNVTGFTPLRDYAATYIAPDNAFPNYESSLLTTVFSLRGLDLFKAFPIFHLSFRLIQSVPAIL